MMPDLEPAWCTTLRTRHVLPGGVELPEQAVHVVDVTSGRSLHCPLFRCGLIRAWNTPAFCCRESCGTESCHRRRVLPTPPPRRAVHPAQAHPRTHAWGQFSRRILELQRGSRPPQTRRKEEPTIGCSTSNASRHFDSPRRGVSMRRSTAAYRAMLRGLRRPERMGLIRRRSPRL